MAADIKHPPCLQGHKPPKQPSPQTPRHKWRRQFLLTEEGNLERITRSYRDGIIARFKATAARALGLISAPKAILRRSGHR